MPKFQTHCFSHFDKFKEIPNRKNFSEIVSQAKVLNLIKKWFSFPGKMLFCDWNYFYLKFDGIYKLS